MIEGFISKIKSYKNNKKLSAVILLAAIGIMLVAISGATKAESDVSTSSLAQYKAQLESELQNMCQSVKGVGKCRVMITFERGEENTYKGSSLVESKPPRVMGVSVICKGADSIEVTHALVDMITALFDIGSNRISVLKLNP